MSGIIVSPISQGVHWLNTSGGASLCGRLRVDWQWWFAQQIDGYGVAREVTCHFCLERMEPRHWRRTRRLDGLPGSPLVWRNKTIGDGLFGRAVDAYPCDETWDRDWKLRRRIRARVQRVRGG
jgi:hypothetical protein